MYRLQLCLPSQFASCTIVLYLSFFLLTLLIACTNPQPAPTPQTTHTPAPSPTPDDPLSQGLVAYYPFNGNANDESGNGNHGIVNGATLTADRHNTPNSAYQFDGIDDYIEIPHATSLNLTSGATISLWLLYQPQATHGYYALVEKSDPERGGHSRWGMWIQEDIAEFCIEPNEMNPIQRCLDSTTTLKVGEWHHIVGRYNGNLLYLTINGEPAGQSEFGFAPIARSNYSLFLGADLYQEDTVYLQGNLDNIRIYNRMLTDEEIERLGE